MYVTKGTGQVFAGEETFEVKPEDVIFVPAKHKFAVEGDLEYITFDSPAFYPEQSKEITE
jgi:mannose-6-phosphate isomerase-like protein (cupin superfamily)